VFWQDQEISQELKLRSPNAKSFVQTVIVNEHINGNKLL
jgi:hypothetical protein